MLDFKKIKSIAIVGLSDKPDRPSYEVGKYLMDRGFKIFPVNPNISNFLGVKSYKTLSEIKEPVDVVDIFRKSEFVEQIVDEAIKIGAKMIWMQEGVSNEVATTKARTVGLNVVMNMCMMKAHKKQKTYEMISE
ncbi:CoA-binding protein [Candidatus Roizmanbacteria bacterium CG06_land_8_20_14_3_00_34_14]|uniref:CoA-binding protein n=2 Tax=Candidatus Roizmaniibacteriota TaxID=1752723 RepID=A0A2M7ATP4_9BACT|nr:MAG: CoA-binding protein [Candidatus Roizmanbacteria bacterium CG07_land_8_20_14_0_80_34_15]PIU73933.1 MAG: CoA-binding protein [Candidatus Roizmanbacteria bacterium CG06_land_8_20_14_3_00_34_14]